MLCNDINFIHQFRSLLTDHRTCEESETIHGKTTSVEALIFGVVISSYCPRWSGFTLASKWPDAVSPIQLGTFKALSSRKNSIQEIASALYRKTRIMSL